jgi:hypothetical protein
VLFTTPGSSGRPSSACSVSAATTGFSSTSSAAMSVRSGGQPEPSAQATDSSRDRKKEKNSCAAACWAWSACRVSAIETPIADAACSSGPAGTGAMP